MKIQFRNLLSLLIFGLLSLTPNVEAQREKNRSGLVPPPAPPFDSKALAPWAEAASTKAAQSVSEAKNGDLEKGITSLAEVLAGEGLEADSKERFQREHGRLKGLLEWRSKWLSELKTKGRKIRVPIEGKMTAFQIAKIEAGEAVFTKARKGVDRVSVGDLNPALLVENLGRGLSKVEPRWLQAYLPSLAGAEWNAAKLKDLDEQLIADLEDHSWMMELGDLATEIKALADAGYPDERKAKLDLIARLGKVQAVQGSIPALAGIDSDLRGYAADLARQAYDQALVSDLLYGKATDLGEGKWKLTYEFDNADEVRDFENVPTLFDYCMPLAGRELPAQSGWLHNDGAIAWGGRAGVLHQVPFEGAMTLRYEWQSSKMGDTYDIQGGNLIFGMAAQPKVLSFVGQAFLHSVWCYKKGQLLNASKGPIPMYEGKVYKCELHRDATGKVTGIADGKDTGEVEVPDVEHGPAFFTTNLKIRGRIERMEMEGTVKLDGLGYLRQMRAYEHLKEIDLAGPTPPVRPEPE